MTDTDAGESFASRTIRLGIARLATLAALLAVNVAAARALTTEEVGAMGVGQTVGLFAAMVANGGLNISTVYFLRRENADRRAVAGGLMTLGIASATLAALLCLAAAQLVFATVLGTTDWPLLAAAAILGAGIISFEFAGALLLGIDRATSFTTIEIARGMGALLAAVLGLLLLQDAWVVVAGLAAGYAGAALLGLRQAWPELRPVPRLDAGLARRSLAFGLRGQAGNIFQYLGLRLDLLLVPALLGLHPAGVYFVVVRVAEVVGQIATAAASFLFPGVAGAADRASTAMTERVTRMTLLLVLLVATVTALLAGPLLSTLFGPPYGEGVWVLVLSLIAIVPLSICRLIASDLKGRGRPGLASAGSGVMAATIVALDLVLIPTWGLIGAAVASVVAYALSAAALLWAYRRTTGARLGALLPGGTDVRTGLAYAGQAFGRRSP